MITARNTTEYVLNPPHHEDHPKSPEATRIKGLYRLLRHYYPDRQTVIIVIPPDSSTRHQLQPMASGNKALPDYFTAEAEEPPLTKREREILTLVACGKSNKQISVICSISEQTVKCHISAVLRKLHASDRAHSVALALRRGFI